jgi:hypothetical protein
MIVPSIRLSTPRPSPVPQPLQHLALDPFVPLGTNTQDWLHKLSQAGPHLQSVRISGPVITSLGWEDEFSDAFLRSLQNMPCLRYLSLCSVDALDVETISRVLESVPQIVTLDADFGVSQDELLRLLTPPMSQDLKNEFPWHPLESTLPAPTLLPNLATLVLEVSHLTYLIPRASMSLPCCQIQPSDRRPANPSPRHGHLPHKPAQPRMVSELARSAPPQVRVILS